MLSSKIEIKFRLIIELKHVKNAMRFEPTSLLREN